MNTQYNKETTLRNGITYTSVSNIQKSPNFNAFSQVLDLKDGDIIQVGADGETPIRRQMSEVHKSTTIWFSAKMTENVVGAQPTTAPGQTTKLYVGDQFIETSNFFNFIHIVGKSEVRPYKNADMTVTNGLLSNQTKIEDALFNYVTSSDLNLCRIYAMVIIRDLAIDNEKYEIILNDNAPVSVTFNAGEGKMKRVDVIPFNLYLFHTPTPTIVRVVYRNNDPAPQAPQSVKVGLLIQSIP